MKKTVLFIHGAGDGAYEEDRLLVASLQITLGLVYDVRYPKMVNEESQEYADMQPNCPRQPFERSMGVGINSGTIWRILPVTYKRINIMTESPTNHSSQNNQDRYASVNDLNMYYEIHGRGEPLVMLHGAFATAGMFFALLPELAQTRQVILVEQQGHGHTADINRPLSFAQMADDTVELLRQLGVKQADIFGYSGGGSVALQIAIRHPEAVRMLALASTVYDTNGYYPFIVEGLRHPSPDGFPPEVRQEYEKVAPHPEDWANLVYKSADMFNQPARADLLDPSQLQAITAPALLVVGDQDIIQPDYATEMAKYLHTQLVTVPGDHASYIVEQPGPLIAQLKTFFKFADNDEL
ncbi:MAG: alpha/beta hydrolase [Chloroflexi bacterium]|nr:MAG: alpha/beta hydrolase [Chloroflexota bacterium]